MASAEQPAPDVRTAAPVLVVDDRPDKRLALVAALGRENEVVTAASGTEALRHLLARPFAVVLMDVHMPGIDGFETARLIRGREQSRDTPIIFVTADDQDAARGYSLGAVDFVHAPFVAEILRAKVAVFVELYRKNEDVRRLNSVLQERLAELTGLNEELEAFSYSVSHDLRAPLRHVLGFVDLLRRRSEETLDEPSRRYLSLISTAATRMTALIDDLLSFSQTSRVGLRWTTVDLAVLVAEVREHLAPDIAEREVIWQIGELPPVWGDHALLRIAFTNLLQNALKYSRGVSPTRIEVAARTEGDRVVVHVRDNGVGFDMAFAGKLFGVFQRLHRVDEFEGTGIGLATVRRIVTRHGGRVWAEASPGEGATFFLALPRSRPPGPRE
jgi:two-component system, sensor histidine kinase and response regulator